MTARIASRPLPKRWISQRNTNAATQPTSSNAKASSRLGRKVIKAWVSSCNARSSHSPGLSIRLALISFSGEGGGITGGAGGGVAMLSAHRIDCDDIGVYRRDRGGMQRLESGLVVGQEQSFHAEFHKAFTRQGQVFSVNKIRLRVCRVLIQVVGHRQEAAVAFFDPAALISSVRFGPCRAILDGASVAITL